MAADETKNGTQKTEAGSKSPAPSLALLEDWLCYAGAGLILSIMLLGGAQVTGRLFNFPIPGYSEIVASALPVIGFLGLAYAQRKGIHLRLTLFIDKFSPQARRLIELCFLVAIMAVFTVIAVSTFQDVMNSIRIHDVTPYSAIPTWPVRASITVGSIALCARLAVQIVRELGSLNRG